MLGLLGVIPRIRNNFVEIVPVAERYFVIAHAKNKESKKQAFSIRLAIKLADGKTSIKKKTNYLYLNYNIVSLGKMTAKTEPFSYLRNLLLF